MEEEERRGGNVEDGVRGRRREGGRGKERGGGRTGRIEEGGREDGVILESYKCLSSRGIDHPTGPSKEKEST